MELYYETYGNSDGIPIVILHGGPGAGLSRSILSIFDLTKWFIVLYNQRGSGPTKTKNRFPTVEQHVNDIEDLRKHIMSEIGRPNDTPWTVYGGSWGTFLALSYWKAFPTSVTALVLRAVCLLSDEEQKWVYEETGAASQKQTQKQKQRKNAWKRFADGFPKRNFRALTQAYRKLLLSPARKTRKNAASRWCDWEEFLSNNSEIKNKVKLSNQRCLTIADQETHHFLQITNTDVNEILKSATRIPPSIPVWILQGEKDEVCPLWLGASRLHSAIPHSHLIIVKKRGHATSPETQRRIISELYQELIEKS